jgi:hypothetical protein
VWRLLDASDPIVRFVSYIGISYIVILLRAEKLQGACFAARSTSQFAVSFYFSALCSPNWLCNVLTPGTSGATVVGLGSHALSVIDIMAAISGICTLKRNRNPVRQLIYTA